MENIISKLINRVKKKKEEKPKPQSLGSGMAADAAQKAIARNKETQKVANLDSYKKGGRVKKTGPAYMHKNEHVLTTKEVKKIKEEPETMEKYIKRRNKGAKK